MNKNIFSSLALSLSLPLYMSACQIMLLLFANAVLRICIFRSFQYSTSPLQLVCVCIMNSKHSTYNSAACHKKMVLSVAPDRKK